jgi:hypothetical protein
LTPKLEATSVSKRAKALLAMLGVVILLVVGVHCWYYLGHWRWPASPEKLAQQALNGATVDEKIRASLRLADCGYKAQEQLRQVFRESDIPEVRAACIRGMGAIYDYDSMDMLLEALEDKSLVVRGSAGVVVSKMVMGHDVRFTFSAAAPEEDRKKAIKSLHESWEDWRDSPLYYRFLRVLERRRGRR